MYRLGGTKKYKKLWVAPIVALLVILLCGGAFVLYRRSSDTGFMRQFSRSASYPVYFPSTTPRNITFVKSSTNYRAGVTTFYFTYNNGKKLIFTEQAKPANFDFSALSGNNEFTTPEGKAYIVDNDLRTTGSLVTEKSWVIINAPDRIDTETMHQLLRNLSLVN